VHIAKTRPPLRGRGSAFGKKTKRLHCTVFLVMAPAYAVKNTLRTLQTGPAPVTGRSAGPDRAPPTKGGFRHTVRAVRFMKKLALVLFAVAVVLLITGLAVQALAFLLVAAPVLAVVAVVLLILNRSGGRRIPR
jgi:hypothetical protein